MAAVDATFRPILSTVGRRLTTRATHADLIISDETRETLEELEATIRLRDRVLDEWDFKKLVRGRGVSALFYGDPGTGKTMAAGVIAAASGLPLYIIDTASLVSKWVGETEKNLGEVFRAAEAGHAMLLFDEADAIFGKRTDVQNSTDRYANMQTNFLLTQIEMFNGVSILTTNRESVMDQAFQRRLTFRVHFPMPEEDEREQLWRKMLEGHDAQADEIALPRAGQAAADVGRLHPQRGLARRLSGGGAGQAAVDGAAQARGRAGAPRRRKSNLSEDDGEREAPRRRAGRRHDAAAAAARRAVGRRRRPSSTLSIGGPRSSLPMLPMSSAASMTPDASKRPVAVPAPIEPA